MRLSPWLAALPPRRTALSAVASSPFTKNFLMTGVVVVSVVLFAAINYKRRNYRISRKTELLGATSMEGIAATDWTKDYAEKSPVQISSTDVQKEITLSNNPKAAAGGVVEG